MNVMSDTMAALKETFTEAELVPYSTWFHSKTGGTYTVLGVATCSTNGDRENVERCSHLLRAQVPATPLPRGE
jgi:hypothetical protein